MMNIFPRQILCRLIEEHGLALCDDPMRFRNLLRDYCGQYRREINVLTAALQERIPKDLLSVSASIPKQASIMRLAKRLQDDLAMEEEAAKWAVQSWGLALCIVTAEDISPAKMKSFQTVPLASESSGAAKAETNPNKTNPKDNSLMIWVPPGSFLMGDDEQGDNPRIAVYVEGFYLYKNLVTVAQFRHFCQVTGHGMPGEPSWGWKDNHPIVNVNSQDAESYCKWAGVSLPSEVQWEKAARGTDGRRYPWGEMWDGNRCAHSVGTARNSTTALGTHPGGASPYGCLDMAGNVWEWCSDWYTPTPKDEVFHPAAFIPHPSSAAHRVLRGGSWDDDNEIFFRCALRYRYTPGSRCHNFGFRCAASALSEGK